MIVPHHVYAKLEEMESAVQTLRDTGRSRCIRWKQDGRFAAANYWDGYQMAADEILGMIEALKNSI